MKKNEAREILSGAIKNGIISSAVSVVFLHGDKQKCHELIDLIIEALGVVGPIEGRPAHKLGPIRVEKKSIVSSLATEVKKFVKKEVLAKHFKQPFRKILRDFRSPVGPECAALLGQVGLSVPGKTWYVIELGKYSREAFRELQWFIGEFNGDTYDSRLLILCSPEEALQLLMEVRLENKALLRSVSVGS
ncbi:MAG: hypothetical protein Q8P49_02870 [Candidatus Liptonbacteria bacterium]|nr:hypothetical protein [Candidatus Liptonbacteria bacterium]